MTIYLAFLDNKIELVFITAYNSALILGDQTLILSLSNGKMISKDKNIRWTGRLKENYHSSFYTANSNSPLQVYINKRWNVIKATDISPSKRQPGTFIVRMEGRSIRVSPASIRPLRGEEPFRSTRYVMKPYTIQ